MQIEPQSGPRETALNRLLGELWPVVGLGEMGQPDGRRLGRSPNCLHEELGAAGIGKVTRVRQNPSLQPLGIWTPAEHRLIMVRFQNDET